MSSPTSSPSRTMAAHPTADEHATRMDRVLALENLLAAGGAAPVAGTLRSLVIAFLTTYSQFYYL